MKTRLTKIYRTQIFNYSLALSIIRTCVWSILVYFQFLVRTLRFDQIVAKSIKLAFTQGETSQLCDKA